MCSAQWTDCQSASQAARVDTTYADITLELAMLALSLRFGCAGTLAHHPALPPPRCRHGWGE